MKKTILFAVGLLLLPAAMADVLITQVLYNPVDETGSEAIELYNDADLEADVSGFIVFSGSTARNYTLPEGTVIPAESHFLIADTGWSTSKDNPAWPDADYEDSLTLYNSDSGVALSDGVGIIDALGWGSPGEFYEGETTSETSEGETLKRRTVDGIYVDTDNNSNDFIIDTSPMFRSSSSYEVNENATVINVIANVNNSCPVVVDIVLLNYDGFGYLPEPGAQKRIDFEAEVSDVNGVGDIMTVSAVVGDVTIPLTNQENLTEQDAIFSGTLYLDFWEEPGVYLLNITAVDYADCSSMFESNFTYLEVVAIETDAATVMFTATPGNYDEVIGDLNMNTDDSPTIRNIGNTPIDFWVSGTDLTYNSYLIESENIEYTFLDNIFSGSLYGLLTNAPQMVSVDLEPAEESLRELSLRFNSPLDALPGSYSARIELFSSVS